MEVLEEEGVKTGQMFQAHSLDSYGYYLDFDRWVSLEKARSVGFGEEVEPISSWIKAFERFKGYFELSIYVVPSAVSSWVDL